MFTSLRAKIIRAFTIIMVVTAATIMYFTNRDIGQAMLEAEEASAQNLSQFIELNLSREYKQLLFFRVDTIRQRRRQLKALSSITASVLAYYVAREHDLPDEQIRNDVRQWLASIPAEGDLYWFVFDREATITASTHRDLEGTSISSLLDLKGRPFAAGMNADELSGDGEFAVFHWDREGRGETRTILGHFVPLAGWDWTFCAAIDISDIEAVIEDKTNKIVKVLADNFADVKIGRTGYSFLFTGEGEVLIPPADGQGGDLARAVNVTTGKSLLQDFRDRAQGEDTTLNYVSSTVAGKEMRATVSYFKPLDWYTVITVPTEEISLPARTLIMRQSLIIAVIFLASLVVTYVFVTRISRPLYALAGYAKELPSQDLTVAAEEGTDEPLRELTKRSIDEVKGLADSFIYMKAELQKNIATLMETTAAKERMQSELNVAHDIQMGFLPKTFPPFPDRKEFDLHATLTPAKEVGGDLYDYYFLDEHRLCFTLGDVSDKGVPAALFMGITKTLIKAIAQQTDRSAAGIMSLVNTIVGADNPNLMFITLVVGILDTRTGEVNYANGGHNPPVLIHGSGQAVYRKTLSGPVVGAMGEIDYKDLNMALAPGDAIFLYTDGVTEAMNMERHLYSDEKLLEETNAIGTGSASEVIDGIMKSVAGHVGDAPPSDDIAMLMIRYHGSKETEQ